jgi:vacuolar-type H+-ATPase catalytic subunit A/Vma1
VNKKKVYKICSKTLKVLEEYESVGEVAEKEGKFNSSVGSLIKRGFLQNNSYVWSFTKTPTIKKPLYLKNVYKFNTETKEVLKVYPSVKEAEGIRRPTMSGRLSNKTNIDNILFTYNVPK